MSIFGVNYPKYFWMHEPMVRAIENQGCTNIPEVLYRAVGPATNIYSSMGGNGLSESEGLFYVDRKPIGNETNTFAADRLVNRDGLFVFLGHSGVTSNLRTMVFHDGTNEYQLTTRTSNGRPLDDVWLAVVATCWGLVEYRSPSEPQGIGWDMLEAGVDIVIGSTDFQPSFLWDVWAEIFFDLYDEDLENGEPMNIDDLVAMANNRIGPIVYNWNQTLPAACQSYVADPEEISDLFRGYVYPEALEIEIKDRIIDKMEYMKPGHYGIRKE